MCPENSDYLLLYVSRLFTTVCVSTIYYCMCPDCLLLTIYYSYMCPENSLLGAVAGCLTGALTTPLGLAPTPRSPRACSARQVPLRQVPLSVCLRALDIESGEGEAAELANQHLLWGDLLDSLKMCQFRLPVVGAKGDGLVPTGGRGIPGLRVLNVLQDLPQ